MEPKYAMVVDGQGYRVDLVLVRTYVGEDGKSIDIPEGYVLMKGERLVYGDEGLSRAIGMTKPRYVGQEWVETATPEEIEAARVKREAAVE